MQQQGQQEDSEGRRECQCGRMTRRNCGTCEQPRCPECTRSNSHTCPEGTED